MANFHSLIVKEVKKETTDAVSIAFDVPSDLTNQYAFIPGQYLTLKAKINNKEIRRAYSICSSKQSGELRVAVKAVPNGVFSTYANEEIKTGDSLEVSTPEGKFIIDTDDVNQNYCAFAAGSGITPIMSMISSTLAANNNSSFTLIYGNKSQKDTIFHSEINNLSNQFGDRFSVIYVFSRENVEESLFGRIDGSVVNYVIKNKFNDISFNKFFICGPEEMINITSENLANSGVDKNNILFELFTSSTSEKSTPVENSNGETAVTILVDDEEHSLTLAPGKFILDACLDKDIDVPYSCQGGVCSSCIARITEGKATMVKNSILTDGEIEEGLILTCQAVSQSAQLVVDYDDV